MFYVLTNKADQPLVCTLGDDSTLRLAINQSKKITEKQMTGHLNTLSSKGILIIKEVVEKKPNKNINTKKSVVEKGGKE